MNKYFIVASLRRCGSSFLSLELDSFDNVFCQYEHILRDPKYKQNAHIIIDGEDFSFQNSINNLAGAEQFRGTKLPIPEYQPDDMPTIIESLKREDVCILHIVRDFHESLVSILQAKKSGNWLYLGAKGVTVPKWLQGDERHVNASKLSSDKTCLKSIHLSSEEVAQYCKNSLTIDKALASLQATNQYMQIEYSKINESIPSILDFLGVSKDDGHMPFKVKSQTPQKIIKVQSKDLICNWNQIESTFLQWEEKRNYRNIIT